MGHIIVLSSTNRKYPYLYSDIRKHPSALLGLSVDGGCDSGGGGSFLLGLVSQVLGDIGGGVGAFQFRLLPVLGGV